mgnify:CR=1 FL=1
MADIKINKTFKLGSKLGQGTYGTIYAGYHHKTRHEVAIKLEDKDTDFSILNYEA